MPQFYAIQLILEDGYSQEESDEITLGSRSIINFIERKIHQLNFTSEFTKLNIYCSKNPVNSGLIRFKAQKRFAGISIQLNISNILDSETYFYEACIKMIQCGFNAAAVHTPLPIQAVNQAIEEFRLSGYINRWIHSDRTWKRLGIRCFIQCDLKIDSCVITQSILHNDELIKESIIAVTSPREWLFYQLLGKLTLKDQTIIYSEKGRVISEYDISNNKLSYPDDNFKFKKSNIKA